MRTIIYFKSSSAMKPICFAVAMLACATACQHAMVPANTAILNTEITNENGQRILAGRASIAAMQMPAYKPWFAQSFNDYKVDSQTTYQLKPLLKHVSMQIFLGSWCGDSRRETPRMLKILATAGIDTARIALIFVDNAASHYKQSPQHEEKGLNIHHVPTFILYEHNKETGRIIESPIVSLEKDLVAILKYKNYRPNYQAINYWRNNVPNRTDTMDETALHHLQAQLQPMVKHYGEFAAYGNMLFAAGEINEATNVFRLNAMLYPGNNNALNTLAEVLIKQNRRKEALIVFEKMLVLTPEDENLKKRIVELKGRG
jgi:tetratricopeptide (TPR) repeat protein